MIPTAYDKWQAILSLQADVARLNAKLGPAPGTPAYNPPWYAATTIFWDPAGTSGGSNANAGTSAGAPVLTFAEIVRRYGSNSPVFNYGQSVIVTQMTAQPAGQDPVFFEPRVTNGGQAILSVTPVLFGTSNITVSTAKVRGAPGTLLTLTLASCPVGVVAGMLAINNTRGSQAIVDSVGATVVMQQPLTTASVMSTAVVPAPVEDDTWASGDSVSFFSLQNVNLKLWRPLGCDETPGGQPSGGWVFNASIADTSGNGTAAYLFSNASNVSVLVSCVVKPHLAASSIGGRQAELFLVGCSLPTGTAQLYAGELEIFGGGLANLTLTTSGPCLVAHDAILHGTIKSNGGSLLLEAPGVYSDGTFIVVGSYVQVDGLAWGAFNVVLDPGGKWWNNTGSTFALKALLTSGTLKFGAVATGSKYQGAGVFVDGVALTPANIDTGGTGGIGLQDPLTGARFCNTA